MIFQDVLRFQICSKNMQDYQQQYPKLFKIMSESSGFIKISRSSNNIKDPKEFIERSSCLFPVLFSYPSLTPIDYGTTKFCVSLFVPRHFQNCPTLLARMFATLAMCPKLSKCLSSEIARCMKIICFKWCELFWFFVYALLLIKTKFNSCATFEKFQNVKIRFETIYKHC